jgi:two-component system, NtrC family, nitrogen regulation sensor histidine kinase GlnL
MTPGTSLYKSLLDNISTAVLLLDHELRIQFMNPAAEMMLEMSNQRLCGESIHNVFSEGGQPLSGFEQALNSGQPFTKRQTVLRLPIPSESTVDYTITPVQIDHDGALIMEIQPLDRLLRISQEETMLASQQSTRMLVRGLAHEIKNPLGGLRGAAQLLARELPDDALRDYTNIIIEEADRLRRLVDQLLGPHKAPDKRPMNVHEVTERVLALLEAETQGRIVLKRDYDPSLPNITGDKQQLIQACLNIARNAMQAVNDQPDGQILLRTRAQRQFTIGAIRHRVVVRIDICDNGPGIPAELNETLFLPMISGRPEGTGLGLSIAQTIVQQHGGLIKHESTPGNTVFSIFLPLESNHAIGVTS